MGPVVAITLAFIGISYLIKKFSEQFVFIRKSNLKYKFLDYIGKAHHYFFDSHFLKFHTPHCKFNFHR
jgi:hypothetical protein